MKQKLQIFVSSTYLDLLTERQAAVEAILRAGHIPAGMELFAAGDKSQLETIYKWIDESDLYMLILGGRYGSVDKDSGKSYTQMEYEYAIRTGKRFFAVVLSDAAIDQKLKTGGRSAIESDHPKELADFRRVVMSRVCRLADDTKDIKLSIHETVLQFLRDHTFDGWVSGKDVVANQFARQEVSALQSELAAVRKELQEANRKLAEGYDLLIDCVYLAHLNKIAPNSPLELVCTQADKVYEELYKRNVELGKAPNARAFDHHLAYLIAGRIITTVDNEAVRAMTEGELAKHITDKILDRQRVEAVIMEADYTQFISNVYRAHFGTIKAESSIRYVCQQAGKAYHDIHQRNVVLGKVAENSGLEQEAIYYIAEHLLETVSNNQISAMTKDQLAAKITTQMIEYWGGLPESAFDAAE